MGKLTWPSCLQLSERDKRDLRHVMITFALSPGLPLVLVAVLDWLGFDPAKYIYFTVQVFLVTMAALIMSECYVALKHEGAPKEPGSPYRPGSAIICAYMPNEQDTIMETVEHFLGIDYEPGLQVILAYNTPKWCPVEADLQDLAEIHPNLFLLKVEGSTSKAQNLNAALNYVTGDFIGMFDADHCPDPDSYHRAWRWLSNGYGVVQGHCLVRNPEESFMAKMVAIEFETIYSVAHPGRYLRDDFGVFGGSNGYWLTPLLQRIGMRGSMLTEDIDSSMRVLEEGGKIGSDPMLISRELATTTARQVWNQRLRWAQGWTQVSMKHVWPMMTNPHFTLKQRWGSFMLLFIREVYPWISMQIMTLLFYWFCKGDKIDWLIPIFLGTTVFTTAVGPLTIIVTWHLCHPTLKKAKWFWQYAFFSLLFYTEAKNVIARVSHVKEFLGESGWRVTPRSAKAECEDLGAPPEDTGMGKAVVPAPPIDSDSNSVATGQTGQTGNSAADESGTSSVHSRRMVRKLTFDSEEDFEIGFDEDDNKSEGNGSFKFLSDEEEDDIENQKGTSEASNSSRSLDRVCPEIILEEQDEVVSFHTDTDSISESPTLILAAQNETIIFKSSDSFSLTSSWSDEASGLWLDDSGCVVVNKLEEENISGNNGDHEDDLISVDLSRGDTSISSISFQE